MAKIEGLSLQEQILANLAKMQPDLAAAFSDAPRRAAETVRSTSTTHTPREYVRSQAEKRKQSGEVDQTSHRSLFNHSSIKDSSFAPCADEKCKTCSQGPVESEESDEPSFRTFNAVRRETLKHEVPGKKVTKKRSKLTKGTKGQFNREALRGVPGGGLKGEMAIMRMIEAEGTGCRVAEDLRDHNPTAYESLQARLARSASNCNTTAGNYVTSRIEHTNNTPIS